MRSMTSNAAAPAVPSASQLGASSAVGRIAGLDLARFLAIAGMVITHAFTDLYSIPRESSASGALPVPSDPGWAEALTYVFAGRSATLFYLLAGISIVLLVKGDPRRASPVLWKRALFLLIVVVSLQFVGWSDSVLLVYAVWFLVAIALLRLSDRWLVALAVLSLALVPTIRALPGLEERLADSGLVGTVVATLAALVVFPLGTFLVCFYLAGVVVGRLCLARPGTAPWLAGVGLTVGTAGLLVLAGLGYGPGDWVLSGAGPVAVTYVQFASVMGFDVAAVGLCLLVGRLAGGRGPALLRPLVRTGSMALTAFVGHAVVFALIFNRYALGFGEAMLVSVTYLAAIVLATNLWAMTGRRGPLEGLMRRFSGPWRRRAPV